MKKSNSEFEFDLNQDLSFSPSGDDHLQIDGDEPKAEQIAEEVVESVPEEPITIEINETPTEQVEETVVETPQEEPAVVEEPVVVEEPKATEETTVKPTPVVTPKGKSKKGKTKNEEKKKKDGLFPILLLIIALLCGGIWYYWSHKQVKPAAVAPVVDTTTVVKEEVPVDIPKEPMVIDTVPPAEPTPPPFDFGRVATKIKVPRNWLIGFRATPDEVLAIKTVAELSYVDSLPCGYYWINDARKNGEKLFKIYIGPFDTKEEAEKELPKIQAKRADAHVYTEDKRYK